MGIRSAQVYYTAKDAAFKLRIAIKRYDLRICNVILRIFRKIKQ